MEKNTIRNMAKILLLVLPIMMLPGCGALDWVKEKLGMSSPRPMSSMPDDMDLDMDGEKKTRNELTYAAGDSEVLVTLVGKPVITLQMLNDELEQLIAEYPELKTVLPMLPDARLNLLKGMLSQVIVDEWVDRNMMDKDPAFKKELDRMIKQAKKVVNQKYFSQAHPIKISDADLKEFYDKHKDKMPDLMISRGGVNAIGVKFTDEQSAQVFFTKAQQGNLSNVAGAQGIAAQVREFKDVNQLTPGIDQSIREALMSMIKFPTTILVKAGKDYWVVQGISKEEPKYQEFNKIKEMLRPGAEQEKRMEHLEGLIEKYKKEYNVQVNEDAVKPDESAMSQGMPGMPANFGEMDMEEEEGPMMPQPA